MDASLLATVIKETISVLEFLYKERKKKLSIKSENIETSIDTHLNYVKTWASDVSFRDLMVPKTLETVFVNLKYQPVSNRLRYEGERQTQLTLFEIFNRFKQNIIIVGLPGSGKSTTSKRLCQMVLFDEHFEPNSFNLPLLIRLREFNNLNTNNIHSNYLFFRIFEILGLKVNVDLDKKGDEREHELLNVVDLIKKSTIKLLDSLKVLLIVDGFDEINDENVKTSVIEDFKELSLSLRISRILFTSRTGSFQYNIENTIEFEISKLDTIQIGEFVKRYISDKAKATKLTKQIKSSPYADTASKPLTIAHLCAIFDRYGRIPEKPKSIYRKVVNLYLEEWNAQNSIYRTSKYGNFDVDRKFEFLCHLSYHLSIVNNKFTFSKGILGTAYKEICPHFSLPINQVQKVIDEIESHTGLFIQTGYDSFEFAHKSIQEYLTAEYIVRLPYFFNDKESLSKIPNELALAIALSSNPTNYFSDLIIEKLRNISLSDSFFYPFIQRIVIEKPDFIVNENVALSYLYILTLQKTKAFNHNDLNSFITLMKRFSSLSGVRESLRLLPSAYEIAISESQNEELILLIKRTDYSNRSFNDIPKYLYMPKHLAKMFN